MGAESLVTLIEGADERLSNEFDIVVCTSFFLQKKLIFCEFCLFFNLIFWKVQAKPFRNIRSFLFVSHRGGGGGGELHAPKSK